jgi:hypothetical protein
LIRLICGQTTEESQLHYLRSAPVEFFQTFQRLIEVKNAAVGGKCGRGIERELALRTSSLVCVLAYGVVHNNVPDLAGRYCKAARGRAIAVACKVWQPGSP